MSRMWTATLPPEADPLEGFTLVGQTIVVAPEHITALLPAGAGPDEWQDWSPVNPVRGVVRFVCSGEGGVMVQCEDPPTPVLRHCRFCDKDIDVTLWNTAGTDHGVVIQGPLTIESLATKPSGESVRFLTSQPYLVVYCSQFDRTLRDLHVHQEEHRD